MGDLADPTSLAETVDRIADAFLAPRPPGKARRREAARFLVSRRGLPGAYRGMFAPTEQDLDRPLRVFTGEKITTKAGRAHVLGEETSRALRLLDVDTRAAREALGEAQLGLLPHLEQTEVWQREKQGGFRGEFCCASCSVALWRNLAVGGFAEMGAARWLAAGLRTLRANRDERGGWGRYPFWFTVLALEDVNVRGVRAERQHAAPRLERVLRRRPKADDRHDARRRSLAERILALC